MAKTTQPSDKKPKKIDLVEVVQHGDQFVLPEGMSLDRAMSVLVREKEYREADVGIMAPIDGFVPDAAHAFYQTLKNIYGWVHGAPTPGFWGDSPPGMITVRTGLNETVQVPWGRMTVPGIQGWLATTVQEHEGRQRFTITGIVKRKDQYAVDRIVHDTREYLKGNSVFKGKAFRLRLLDYDGSPIEMPEPSFLDINRRLKNELVFSQSVQDAIDTSIFTPIEHTEAVRRLQIPRKRGILLSGRFGTGKSMTSTVVADKCVANGWTFVLCERADELTHVLRLAREFTPCVVFCEDIDRVMEGRRTLSMDELLNVVDGVEAKNSELMVIFTTNDVQQINKAMLRPGRLDAVIEVLPPDAEAVDRLMRIYSRGLVAPEADIQEAAAMMAGEIPAVIQEVVERSKLAAIHRAPGTDFGPGAITNRDLVAAAHSMRNQMELLREVAPDRRSEEVKAAQIVADSRIEAARIQVGERNGATAPAAVAASIKE